MDFALRYRSQFDASHLLPGVRGCQRRHGHTFRVTVSVEGPLMVPDDPESGGVRRVRDSDSMQEALDAVTAELDLRDLGEMMIGSETVPETIAAWILERLPGADTVEVEMGWRRETGWARRTRR